MLFRSRRLESQGLLVSQWREEDKRNKRFYRLSPMGAEILEQLMGEWQRRLEKLSPLQMTISCILLGLLLALPFAPMTWRKFQRTRTLRNPQRAPRTSASFWYMRMLKMMARRGVSKAPSQTPEEFASSIPDPIARHGVELFTEHYERARFDESVEDAQRLPELYEEIAGRK